VAQPAGTSPATAQIPHVPEERLSIQPRAGGSRKAADMHCTMMSDHDLPVVVNPFN